MSAAGQKQGALVVRAVETRDLEGLLALALLAGGGMTTLKPDRDALAQRLAIASASFAETIPAIQRDYLFVMEDTLQGRLVGVCAIKAAVGLEESFYNYRIGTLVHASKTLDVYTRMETLYLSNDLTGSGELCSLFLHPDYRWGENGRLLSKSRLLFIAQFPHLFSDRLIAELRGFLRPDGSSPFWESLGRHFFKMGFDRADELSSLGKKSFIAELMPRYPLYAALLPREAQDAIGRVHDATLAARAMLEQEGMHFEGYVDIFDAGPVLQARIGELRSVRESALTEVSEEVAAMSGLDGMARSTLVANTVLSRFVVIASPAVPLQNRIGLTRDTLNLLHCAPGDMVRCVALRNAAVAS